MARVPVDIWCPHGVPSLEPNAWKALKTKGNTSVVAGPGAGKTEFLAQRAAFLLETGMCQAPQRILAISFKSDAAENLAARVKKRCDPALSNRFVSLTFDAFTKSLVDRFHYAIPQYWRPTLPYEIIFPTRRDIDGFLERMRNSVPSEEWRGEIAGLQTNLFEAKTVGSLRLSNDKPVPKSGSRFAVVQWWIEHLRRSGAPSRLSFVMINRLAELLVRSNPEVARALRATFRFLFVDEFQDTTYAQYDFLRSVFSGSRATLTTVGDCKQRIMAWAGAIPDIFVRFTRDFDGAEVPLLFNFRSSPGLVQIQKVVASAIESNTPEVVSQTTSQVGGDVAQVWKFGTVTQESLKIVEWLKSDMVARGTRARDYGLLVRQTADRFEGELTKAFALEGLHVRNESKQVGRTTIQDLLSEKFSMVSVALMRLAISKRNPVAWSTATEALERLRFVDPEDAVEVNCVTAELTTYMKSLRRRLKAQLTAEAVDQLVDSLMNFTGHQAWRQTSPEYATGDKLEIMLEAFRIHLKDCVAKCDSLGDALNEYEGSQHTPLMTVHKSKGLEYDTMVFIGLDDENWWSHTTNNPDGLATFFVALSRAKQRAIFTFCTQRGDRRKVADLYNLLRTANVPEVEFLSRSI
jgi:superfamily I DNA/RNA helicase